MDSLNWRQDSDGLHVTVDMADGQQAMFSIGNSQINFLLAGTPRIYHVYVKDRNSDQEVLWLLNLDNLRPVISKQNGLKLSIGRRVVSNTNAGRQVIGCYSLARGESYHDRYLSEKGWQAQRVYMDLFSMQGGLAGNSAPSDIPAQSEIPERQAAPKLHAPAPRNTDFDDVDLDLTDDTNDITYKYF